MRVIAGAKRHILLDTVPGLTTRPTSDQIKETLFNILAPDLYDICFLDIFAGSGQMGIEALSRGAAHAWFVEKDYKALKCIKSNLTRCQLSERADVLPSDFKSALLSPKMPEHADLIFMDPPYNHQLEKEALEILADRSYVDGQTKIVIEASKETEFPYLDELGYEIIRQKLYKTNQHLFVRKKE